MTIPKPAIEARAWCQPDYNGEIHPRKFMVVYEDAEMRPAIFDEEDEAREHFEQATINWNCYLFGLLSREPVPAPPAPAIPAGWKMVPIDPTDRMEDRAADALGLYDHGGYGSETEARNAIYRAMLEAAPEPPATNTIANLKRQEPDFAKSIEHVVDEESKGGAACGWKPCSGCYDTEDGQPTGHYPHSAMFNCDVGSGCSECGGLGVVWEYWTAEALDEIAKDCGPPSVTPANPLMEQMARALEPFREAYEAYTGVMRASMTSGNTLTEIRFSAGERQDEASERAFDALSCLTFEQLAAVADALDAYKASKEDNHD